MKNKKFNNQISKDLQLLATKVHQGVNKTTVKGDVELSFLIAQDLGALNEDIEALYKKISIIFNNDK